MKIQPLQAALVQLQTYAHGCHGCVSELMRQLGTGTWNIGAMMITCPLRAA